MTTQRPTRRRPERGLKDLDEGLGDLIDVGEDILDEVQGMRKDIQPVIWLAWINLILLAIIVLGAIIIVVAGTGEGG